MSNVRARYVLQTVQAPPTTGPHQGVTEIEPPKGYKLRDWRAFGTGGGDDAWGYALILWERE